MRAIKPLTDKESVALTRSPSRRSLLGVTILFLIQLVSYLKTQLVTANDLAILQPNLCFWTFTAAIWR